MTDRRRPIPDLKEVLERARRLDADAVNDVFPEGMGEQDAAVVEFVPRDTGPSPALAGFLSDVRDELDAKAEQRSMESIPAPPRMRPKKRWSVLGAAAVLVVLGGASAWGLRAAGSSAQTAQVVEAPMTAPAAAALPLAPVEGQRGTAADAGVQVAEVVQASEASLAEPETLSKGEPESEPADRAKAAATKKAKPTGDELADLEARAYEAWGAGRLDEAESLLREFIKGTRSRSQREQVYGDLLSLVEQRGNQQRTVALWRSYLRRYPTGRYADDLQARLCRSEGSAACWNKYLKKHPKGAHRQEAESASAD